MQGRNKATLPGTANNASSNFLGANLSQRRLATKLSCGSSSRRCRWSPGKLPRRTIIRSALSNASGAISEPPAAAGLRQESDKVEPAANGASGQRPRTTRSLYKVSDDPLLLQTKQLLEASRRLREQSAPYKNVDSYYGCSSSPSSSVDATGLRSGLGAVSEVIGDIALQHRKPLFASSTPSSSRPSENPSQPGSDADGAVASFGSLVAATATAAARISAARITALNAAAASVAAAAPPTTAPALDTALAPPIATAAAGRAALTAAATTASVAAAAAVMPPAASASAVVAGGAGLSAAAASAASAASSGWLAIEELLEEAAYSLSQELPNGRASSPLDTLLAASAASSSSPGSGALVAAANALGSGGAGGLRAGDLKLLGSGAGGLSAVGGGGVDLEALTGPLSQSVAALPQLGSGLAVAVPGGDRLSEMLEDLLYSLSQDINVAATQEAVLAAASAAAAGLAGAAAELPRAAASVYRSAAEAAAAAAAARAATAARLPEGGGSGGTAFTVPDESQAQPLASDISYDTEMDAGDNYMYDSTTNDNPAWDPFGTIRLSEQGASGAVAAGQAAGDAAAAATAAAPSMPIVTATAAPTVADAATATAAAVVEAATTAAAGTIVLPPPPVVVTPPAPPSVVAAAAAAPPPSVAAAVQPPLPPPALEGAGGLYGMGAYGLDSESAQQLDELTSALQSLLALPEGAASTAAAASGLGMGSEAANAAVATAAAAAAAPLSSAVGAAAAVDPSAAEAALSTLTEALRRELGAVAGAAADTADADPGAMAAAAGAAVSAALSSSLGSMEQSGLDLTSLPQDARLSTLLGATLQSSLDLVESALGGVRSADSTLVGGVTIAAVMAVLIRSLVSLAGSALVRGREGVPALSGLEAGVLGWNGSETGSGSRLRAVGVTSLEAAAALNNDPQALLLDIRNGSDIQEQGLPDLRPFRRGAGATAVPLPYCDFRTTPTLANPSGLLSAAAAAAAGRGKAGSGAATATGGGGAITSLAAAVSGPATVAVDPMFVSKFKGLEGLGRDSRVFLLDSYGIEAPEAVLLLRADPELERLLGAQGIKYVEGGFAGPEGWKLTGLPVADAPTPEGDRPGEDRPAGQSGLGLDLSGLLSGVAGLRLRYPSLFSRTLAVGAAGGAGLAVATSLDWGAVSRGAVGLAAAMLLTDRALPPGMRPSGRIRQYLQQQLSSEPPMEPSGGNGSGGATGTELQARRRRTALLLRALDLAEAVGDAVVRAGGAAVTAAGTAAKDAMASRAAASSAAADTAIKTLPGAVAPTTDIDVEAALETPPPPLSSAGAATIVLPHGMDSLQWSQAAELAVIQGQQQQPPEAQAAAKAPLPQHQPRRSASPLRPNWRLGPVAPAEDSNSNEAQNNSSSRTSSSSSASRRTASSIFAAPSPASAAAVAAAGVPSIFTNTASSASSSSQSPSRASSPLARMGNALRTAADAVVRAASPSRPGGDSRAGSPRTAADYGHGAGHGSQPGTRDLMAALATASALSSVDSGALPGWPAVSFPKASAGQAPPPPPHPRKERKQEEEEEAASASHTSSRPRSSLLDPRHAAFEAAAADAATDGGGDGGSPWSNWRQELEEVAPPPPTLPSAAADGGQHPRPAQQPQPQERSRSVGKRPLRTSSPERAAAAGAAMRLLRLQLDGLDDDGLASGAYGGGGLNGGANSDDEAAYVDQTPSSPSSAPAPSLRQKRLLRTASPERAAAAAAAMRRLRAEMGLPPNDSVDGGGGGLDLGSGPAVVPRDWRRELQDAAALPAEPETSADQEAEPLQRRSSGGGGRSNLRQAVAGAAGAATAAAAAAVAATTAAAVGAPAGAVRARSPRNWRDQVEGRGGSSAGGAIPPDWRSRVESGDPVAAVGGGSGGASALRSSVSPGRAKLSAAERAERDARLQDWRARV